MQRRRLDCAYINKRSLIFTPQDLDVIVKSNEISRTHFSYFSAYEQTRILIIYFAYEEKKSFFLISLNAKIHSFYSFVRSR